VAAGQTIREVLESLGIRLPVAVIPLVNGQTEDLSYRLQAEDQVRLLIQLSGGC
jgi:sulfur carrier protein ThiS